MTRADRGQSSIQRQLKAFEEFWKQDHNEAMECRDWEDGIAIGIAFFHLLREREQHWRDQVFRGVLPFSSEDNSDHQLRFVNWIDTVIPVLTDILPRLECRFGVVERAEELRECAELARKIVSEWQPPRLSVAVGLREMTLSAESAIELDNLLRQVPGKIPAEPRMEEMSADELKRRSRK